MRSPRPAVCTPPLLHALATHIAAFHGEAEQRPDRGGVAGLAAIIRENDDCLRASHPIVFPAESVGALRKQSEDWLSRLGALLDQRQAAGKVRRCHGDLHLRNICVLDDKPVLFDCIEFSEAFTSIDAVLPMTSRFC